jgi:hypothetical protein
VKDFQVWVLFTDAFPQVSSSVDLKTFIFAGGGVGGGRSYIIGAIKKLLLNRQNGEVQLFMKPNKAKMIKLRK